MDANKESRAPIFRFLLKHKWRIILPLLFALFYWSLPRYQVETVAVQQTLFMKSSTRSEDELRQEVANVQKSALSDENLAGLVSKYQLYPAESSENAKIEKLRRSIEVRTEEEDVVGGTAVLIWAHFRKESGDHVTEISSDLAAPFENLQGVHIENFLTRPHDANPYRNYVFFGGLLQGFSLLVIPLIFLWEIPNLFYSSKTREMVFEPLRADWQEELADAKLNRDMWKILVVNVRYSVAFVSSVIQKSPLGDLVEFVGKLAK